MHTLVYACMLSVSNYVYTDTDMDAYTWRLIFCQCDVCQCLHMCIALSVSPASTSPLLFFCSSSPPPRLLPIFLSCPCALAVVFSFALSLADWAVDQWHLWTMYQRAGTCHFWKKPYIYVSILKRALHILQRALHIWEGPSTFWKGPDIFWKEPYKLCKGPYIFWKGQSTFWKGPYIFW